MEKANKEKAWYDHDEELVLSKGIMEQIRDMPEPEPITRKGLEKLFNTLQKQDEERRNMITKMEKAHSKHFAQRAKELGEEPPLWLMLITSPRQNMINGGHFFTSQEFLEKHSKWLKDYNK